MNQVYCVSAKPHWLISASEKLETQRISCQFCYDFFFPPGMALALLEWVLKKQADIYGIATIL